MVYNQKFIAAVKVDGKILREVNNNDNEVILPFGSEYSIQLMNLDHRRAVANITIDGNDVLDGSRLVLDPNSSSEIKGVMKGGKVKNNFKFIQKTSKIQDHRGDKVDDGFIRIEFGFEREFDRTWYTYHDPVVYKSFDTTKYNDVFYRSCDQPRAMADVNISASINPLLTGCSQNQKQQLLNEDEGITVAGSETSQKFSETHVGSIEDKNSIVIKLKGTTSNNLKVTRPLTVKTKIECPTCGTKSKSNIKYCPECGTNIQV